MTGCYPKRARDGREARFENPSSTITSMPRITLSLADTQDRQSIYALRHQVYAQELGQHHENNEGALTDVLDQVNTYVVAKRGGLVVGFVAITPPNPHGYSVDKYFTRPELPFAVDEGVFEVRLLTVVESDRRSMLATLLMYGALRYMESRGARVMIAIGRQQVLSLYQRAGLRAHGLQVQAGAVTYELMSADVVDVRRQLGRFDALIQRFEQAVEWQIDGVPCRPDRDREGDVCDHGGAFWKAIGDSFETLERKDRVISADVLDAWFDPAPEVIRAVERCLAFALKTSPPTGGDGMRRVIARSRGVAEENILTAAGSSDLHFRRVARLGRAILSRAHSRSHVHRVRTRARTDHRSERGSPGVVTGEWLPA